MARGSGVPVGRAAAVGLAFVTCGLLAGCGGAPATPTSGPAATPTPAPSPSPVAATFLHVRQEGGAIDTYRVDDATGMLQVAGTQRLGVVHALASDPAGRFVYVASGPRDAAGAGRQDASITSYASDRSGNLVELSEATSRPWGPDDCWDEPGWTTLLASADRVWGFWRSRGASYCHHVTYQGVSHPVAIDGRVGEGAYGRRWEDWGTAAVDAQTSVLYVIGSGLDSYVAGSDGSLKTMGGTHLCVGSHVWMVDPLVGVRGFVFGRAEGDHEQRTVCSWEGPRLAPRANLGFDASSAAAFAPSDTTAPALLAMAGPQSSRAHGSLTTNLRLLSMEADGRTTVLDVAELSSEVWQLLFHPSGRFLYVADEDGTLWAYDVGPALASPGLSSPTRRLLPIASVPHAANPSRVEGQPSPSADLHPSFMAVSVPRPE